MGKSKSLQTFIEDWNTGHKTFLTERGAVAVIEDLEAALKEMRGSQAREYLGLSLVGKHEALLALYNLGYREPIDNRLRHVFLTGHFYESLLITNMIEYGLELSHLQETVEVAGFPGHTDVVIDGELYDVKTTSASHFKSFTKKPSDTLGYITQLVAYHYALRHEVGDNPGWVLYNKETSEIAEVKLFDHIDMDEYDRLLNRIFEKRQVLDNICNLEMLYLLYPPEPRKEIYKREETGRLILPTPLKFSYYGEAFYDLEVGINGYGKQTEYITRRKQPEETKQWLYDYGIHLGDLNGHEFID